MTKNIEANNLAAQRVNYAVSLSMLKALNFNSEPLQLESTESDVSRRQILTSKHIYNDRRPHIIVFK